MGYKYWVPIDCILRKSYPLLLVRTAIHEVLGPVGRGVVDSHVPGETEADTAGEQTAKG